MKQLSGMDASFVYFETPNAPGHIFSVWIYDQSSAPGGAVTFKGILEHVGSRLHVSRTFRQRLVQVPLGLDHPYWIEDPDFDLEYHVRHIALPRPGDWRQFCIQVARLHSRPLDLSRPLWEMYVIEGLDDIAGLPNGQLRDHDEDPPRGGRRGDAARDHQRPQRPRARCRRARADHRVAARAPPDAARAAVTGGHQHRRAADADGPPDRRCGARRLGADARAAGPPELRSRFFTPAPRTRFSGTVTTHRVVEARRFDLATAKAIKNAVPGATINDVAITVVGGALREYLMEHDELPEQALRVMAPISTRTAEQAGTAGNQVSAMVVTAGTDVADARQRLVAVHESTAASKAAAEATAPRTSRSSPR